MLAGWREGESQETDLRCRGLGLGCSRFGSVVDGIDEAGADCLIETALEAGVKHFDTADIYGQGDSERMLGRRLRAVRSEVVVASKVGQRFPFLQRALRPLKGPISALFKRAESGRAGLSRVRSRPLPRSYEPGYLDRAATASLRRLGFDHVDILYLHSPSASDLADGSAVGCLDGLRRSGLLGRVGVSCDDLDTARQALGDPRVSVLQMPLLRYELGWDEVLTLAYQRNVAVVVRSIFGGSGSGLLEDDRKRIVTTSASTPKIHTMLLGTSQPAHLRQVASWIEEARSLANKP